MKRWIVFVLSVLVTLVACVGVARAQKTDLSTSSERAIILMARAQAAKKTQASGTAVTAKCRAWTSRGSAFPRCKLKRYNLDQEMYRGSFLMWAKDQVNFFGKKKRGKWRIKGSSARQSTGAVAPNFSEPRGIRRSFASKRHHVWHGRYRWGARVKSQWLEVTIWSEEISSRWDLKADGRYFGRWLP